MLMKTQDAKIKWCPFGKMFSSMGGAINRGGDDKPETFCLADKCMAWEIADESKGGYCRLIDKP